MAAVTVPAAIVALAESITKLCTLWLDPKLQKARAEVKVLKSKNKALRYAEQHVLFVMEHYGKFSSEEQKTLVGLQEKFFKYD